MQSNVRETAKMEISQLVRLLLERHLIRFTIARRK